jgi:hypothetical protein
MKKEGLIDNEVSRMFSLATYAKKIGLNIDDLTPIEIEPLQTQIENLLIKGIKDIKDNSYISGINK